MVGTNIGKGLPGGQVLCTVSDLLNLPSFLEVTAESEEQLEGVEDTLVLWRQREAVQGRILRPNKRQVTFDPVCRVGLAMATGNPGTSRQFY